MRRRAAQATNHPSHQSSAAAAPRARPDQSSLGSLVRTAGTGTNGEHDPCVTGDGSPPFVPMPLPSFAHHRRGMGCGGGRPTTHRTNRPPPPHPVPAPTNRHWAVWSAWRARERTANMIRASLATGRRRSSPCPYRHAHIIVGAWGAAAGDQPPIAPIVRRRRTPCPARPIVIGHCLVRTAGTGTNGEHDPRAIGDGFPPFVPMPLPSFASRERCRFSNTPRRAFLRSRPGDQALIIVLTDGELQYPAGHSSDFEHRGGHQPAIAPLPVLQYPAGHSSDFDLRR